MGGEPLEIRVRQFLRLRDMEPKRIIKREPNFKFKTDVMVLKNFRSKIFVVQSRSIRPQSRSKILMLDIIAVFSIITMWS